jgi:hypothetical protein
VGDSGDPVVLGWWKGKWKGEQKEEWRERWGKQGGKRLGLAAEQWRPVSVRWRLISSIKGRESITVRECNWDFYSQKDWGRGARGAEKV